SNGEFTTSRYYADTLPTWIKRVNARRTAQRYAGQSWNLLLPTASYAEPDSEAVENEGANFIFPHVLPADTARAASDLPYTPWMDEFTLAAALEGLDALKLGAGTATDVLAIKRSCKGEFVHPRCV